MDDNVRDAVWRQYGAAIDMLDNAIIACPDTLWGDKPGTHKFWYLAYHTIFFLDFYLSNTEEDNFTPPEPFGLTELDPSGAFPERVFSKDELRDYLRKCRDKCRSVVLGMTEAEAHRPSIGRRGVTTFELLLYNMRHTQHHAAQLNLLLRQAIDSAPRWVSIAKE